MPGTGGWDTVYAIAADQVNQAIAAAQASPTTFSWDSTSGLGAIHVEGKFGDWRIGAGGSGQDLAMDLPIETVTITIGTRTPVSATDAVANISVQLEKIPQPTISPTAVGFVVAATQAVTVNQLPPPSGQNPDPTEWAVLRGGLESWLDSHLVDFTHVFATVDIDYKLDQKPGLQWVVPTHTEYAVVDTASGPVFGVLTMTNNDDWSTLVPQVAADVLPTGADAAYLVSSARFLDELLLPGVMTFFKDCSTTDFGQNAGHDTLTNVSDLNFVTFELDNGKMVDASIAAGKFTAQVIGDRLVVHFADISFNYSLGVYAHVDHTSHYKAVLDTGGRVKFDLVGDPVLQVSVEQSEGTVAAEVLAGILVEMIFAGIGVGVGIWADNAANAAVAAGGAAGVAAPVQLAAGAAGGVAGAPATGISAIIAAVGDFITTSFTRFTGWFMRISIKIRAGVGAALLGVAAATLVGLTGTFITKEANNNMDDIPTLKDLTDTALTVVDFGTDSGFTPTSAVISEGLLVGGQATPP